MGDRDQKTEKPTPRRLKKARQEGRIPKSMELVAWASLLGAVFLLQLTVKLAGSQFRPLFTRTADAIAHPEDGPARAMAARCVRLVESPPPEWDGVFALQSK